jgi:hypothetical protein
MAIPRLSGDLLKTERLHAKAGSERRHMYNNLNRAESSLINLSRSFKELGNK